MKLHSDSRPRASSALLAHLASRLTERDRYLCQVLHDHRVLTSDQIAELAFHSHVAARHRLVTLYRLRVLDRFRPHTHTGSAPFHYVLDEMGAAVLAAQRGIDPADLGYRRDKALALAHNQRLAHLVGVNGFFSGLTAAARSRPDASLVHWWSERRCAATWGEIVRPDGYGRWHQNNTDVDFFLESDRGTEPLARLVDKLDGYADLQTGTGVTTWVLFWLPGPRREAALRKLLDHPPVPVATAYPVPDCSPIDAVWLPANRTPWARMRLVTLGELRRS